MFPVSARSQGMGSVRVMLGDPWSGLQNQAGLAALQEYSFAFHYENHFLVPQMGLEAFTLCLPTRTGTLSLNYSCYGYAAYNENRIGLAFGKSFGDKFRAGLELNYMRVHQAAGHGNMHTVIPAFGIQAMPVKQLIIAFHVFNPARQGFGNHTTEPVPAIIRLGTGLLLGDEVLICLEIEKKSSVKPASVIGMEYSVSKQIYVRMGVRFGEYAQASFGLGYQLKSLQIDLAVWRHPVLGYSPALSVSCSFGTNRAGKF